MKLYNSDCLEVLKDIPDKSIDFICCDLPYGATANNWDKQIPMGKLWQEYKRLIKPNGVIALFASGMFVPRVIISNLEWYKYSWIWLKRNSTGFIHAKNRPMTIHEQILVFSPAPMGHKSQLGNRRMTYNPQGLVPCKLRQKQGVSRMGSIVGRRPSHLQYEESYVREWTNYPTDVLTDFPDLPPNKKLHTNEKPVPLLEYLIRTYTDEGGIVLDNCMGSGSCGVACVNTGRDFVGIEIDEDYFNIAEERIKR